MWNIAGNYREQTMVLGTNRRIFLLSLSCKMYRVKSIRCPKAWLCYACIFRPRIFLNWWAPSIVVTVMLFSAPIVQGCCIKRNSSIRFCLFLAVHVATRNCLRINLTRKSMWIEEVCPFSRLAYFAIILKYKLVQFMTLTFNQSSAISFSVDIDRQYESTLKVAVTMA